MWSIEKLQQAWHLAARLHEGQKYAGPDEGEQFEYLNHIGSVTFEILNALQQAEDLDADLAIQCAVLHDTIEDTQQSYAGIVEHFGEAVANGVMALTKNEALPDKAAMMQDSLQRIKEQPKAVWAVKMADRICNLQPPPYYWTREKKEKYREEARLIHRELREGHAYLAARLAAKIEAYGGYIG
ncbi:HD domain-containing protein [Neolewinella lacunae]|uniref:Bifunctional (P)ppGpp synthetase/guanosine-3',5'-bis(Diphosphate) 3'-pyrophosphohydrolase n=1 Tax=Neolewinella lacunae TaxID=1517758 RepID=A0A923PRL7_9BACT|nr:HD domain-containing protein [Neolewinella lacunae]MBC6996214.1 bifunctional (p)ppGpp synthetase/guanosine-3',5'-bis(diphosphate) 3'-pyrophosphohydrolase [Neolewinella lacunae]MDN3637171.1 HD domain-containing protein [Neolewinella lacunae]